MTSEQLYVLARVSAINATIDGMKAENSARESQGLSQAYSECHFNGFAKDLDDLAVRALNGS